MKWWRRRQAMRRKAARRQLVGAIPGGDGQWQVLETPTKEPCYDDRSQVREVANYTSARWRPHHPPPDTDWDELFGGYEKQFPAIEKPTVETFEQAIALAKRSSVGPSRLPRDPYLCCKEASAQILRECSEDMAATEEGNQPADLNAMRLAQLLKKKSTELPDGRIMANVKDLRPVSLSSFFRRFLVGGVRMVIAGAFLTFLHSAQFLFGGSMLSSVAQCSGHLAFMQRYGQRGGLLQVDFEIAFGSLSWAFLEALFRRIGMAAWLVCFHNRSYRRAYHRFVRGKEVHIGIWVLVGVMQGDALAMYVFCLAMDFVIFRLHRRMLRVERLLCWADDLTAKLKSLLRAEPFLLCVEELAPYTNLAMNFPKMAWIFVLQPTEEELAA